MGGKDEWIMYEIHILCIDLVQKLDREPWIFLIIASLKICQIHHIHCYSEPPLSTNAGMRVRKTLSETIWTEWRLTKIWFRWLQMLVVVNILCTISILNIICNIKPHPIIRLFVLWWNILRHWFTWCFYVVGRKVCVENAHMHCYDAN